MKGQGYKTQVTRGLLASLLGAAAGCALAVQPAFPAEGQSMSSGQTHSGQTQAGSDKSVPQAPAEQPAAGAEIDSGMTVYIDPQTGAVRPTPAPGTLPLTLSPQERNARSTSDRGLAEVPSSVPGGGVKVDLQGRFQSPLIGTVDPNGKARMKHLGEPPETEGRK